MIDYSLYLVTDETLAGTRGVETVVRAAVAGGVTLVQVREKRGDRQKFLAHTRTLTAWLRTVGVPLIVNDSVEIALAVDADGVHVGQGDMPCAEVRRLVGPQKIIGVSVGSVDEARKAERDGANYLGISPIFATPTKPDAPPPVGLEGLRAIRAAVSLPLVAIGGIHAGNAAQILAAGADGIAVVSAIMSASDPTAAARQLRVIISARR